MIVNNKLTLLFAEKANASEMFTSTCGKHTDFVTHDKSAAFGPQHFVSKKTRNMYFLFRCLLLILRRTK